MSDTDEQALKSQKSQLVRHSLAWVQVRTPEGNQSIGTAFHIGNGVYLTAKHLVEHNQILLVQPLLKNPLFEEELLFDVPINTSPVHNDNTHLKWDRALDTIAFSSAPYMHPDPSVDVAALVVNGVDKDTPYVDINAQFNDFSNHRDWLLTHGAVISFPQSISVGEPEAVLANVVVNAVIDTPLDRYVRFIVSTKLRGNLSGGPVFHERGFLLGMVSENMESATTRKEEDFLIVLDTEPLRECLEAHDLLPQFQNPQKAYSRNPF